MRLLLPPAFALINDANRLRQSISKLSYNRRRIALYNRYRLFNRNALFSCHFSTMSREDQDDVFTGHEDRFNGVTILSKKEPCTMEEFPSKLSKSIQYWKQNDRRGIWFKVHLDDAAWVPVLAKSGFKYHHTKEDTLTMYLWLAQEQCNIPQYAHTLIGVGAVVVNDQSQVLVVSEKHYTYPHWKLPGGYVEPGENLIDAAIREVHEETNIRTEFRTMLGFRQTHHGMFNCSDIYTVIALKPLNDEIVKCDREIMECKWMDIKEYLKHPHVHELNRFIVQKYLEFERNGYKIDCFHGLHQKLKVPYVLYYMKTSAKDGPEQCNDAVQDDS